MYIHIYRRGEIESRQTSTSNVHQKHHENLLKGQEEESRVHLTSRERGTPCGFKCHEAATILHRVLQYLARVSMTHPCCWGETTLVDTADRQTYRPR